MASSSNSFIVLPPAYSYVIKLYPVLCILDLWPSLRSPCMSFSFVYEVLFYGHLTIVLGFLKITICFVFIIGSDFLIVLSKAFPLLIDAWKCNFQLFKEIITDQSTSQPTNKPINQPTDRPTGRPTETKRQTGSKESYTNNNNIPNYTNLRKSWHIFYFF